MASEKLTEATLREMFEENFRTLSESAGHVLNDYMKENAFRQVMFYWQKNKELISKITRSEVKLSLPEQRTPNKKIPYTIEGVVDIVAEGDEVWLYDLKTHDAERVKGEPEKYKEQLNIYAHIWCGLQKNKLDNTAIISTPLPASLKNAIETNNAARVKQEFERWQPVIPFGYSEEDVAEMIEKFGDTVEKIEGSEFTPPPVEKLNEKKPGMKTNFANMVCSNCDVRYSCSSYIEHMKNSRGARRDSMLKYMAPTASEQDEFIEGCLH